MFTCFKGTEVENCECKLKLSSNKTDKVANIVMLLQKMCFVI